MLGYRAPSFSIGRQNQWALSVLEESGYRYSSSIYPVQHDHYGMPDAPRFAYYPHSTGGLLELPITTMRSVQAKYSRGRRRLFQALALSGFPMVYTEAEPSGAPSSHLLFPPLGNRSRAAAAEGHQRKTRFRHYYNLHRMEERIKALTRDFKWDRMDRIFLD